MNAAGCIQILNRGLRCGNQTPKVFNVISLDKHVGVKRPAVREQPRMGLNTKATESDQDLDIESRPKALVCSTPSGVARIADHLTTGCTRGFYEKES